MDYQQFDSPAGVVYGYTLRSAGRFETDESILNFIQGIKPQAKVLIMDQDHTANVTLVTDPTKQITRYPSTDALFYPQANKHHYLVIKTADCLPVLIWDKQGNLGVAHAGWRGSLEGITGKLLEYFLAQTSPDQVYVFIGPSISFCCYPIYGKRLQAFKQAYPAWVKSFIIPESDGNKLDLKVLNFLQIKQLGIPESNIYAPLNCTSCQQDKFFSYHRDGKGTGQIISWLALSE